MSEAHARAWWADVEHLREAAERRSAERAKARIEGRDPVALTPLRPLHAVNGLAAFVEALEAVEPAGPGDVPRRRFVRDGARTAADADRADADADADRAYAHTAGRPPLMRSQAGAVASPAGSVSWAAPAP